MKANHLFGAPSSVRNVRIEFYTLATPVNGQKLKTKNGNGNENENENEH